MQKSGILLIGLPADFVEYLCARQGGTAGREGNPRKIIAKSNDTKENRDGG